jgi:hypothetical protein
MKIHRFRSLCRFGAAPAVLAALIVGAGTQSLTVAVEPVPVVVRVYEGGRFVPNLKLEDFTIEESGLAIRPEALFQVRKNTIERHEGRSDIRPDLSRRIVLLFQLTQYSARIPEALEFLFLKELLPDDTLEIQTPMRNYKLTAAALAARPREVLARELTGLVRKDITEGSMAYNSALRDLSRYVRLIGGIGRTGLGDTEGEVDTGTSLEQKLMQYGEHLREMETLRMVDADKLIRFAEGLKAQNGQNLVFFVYQREFRPEISPQTQQLIAFNNQDRPDILAALENLFPSYRRSINLDREAIIKAFADSGMHFDFLFMNRPPERVSGLNMREQSEDVFKVLSGAAEATGGTTDSSQNVAVSLASALKATESAYILYYRTSAAGPPGTFINLTVSVKDKDVRVVHRAGYFTSS